MDMESNGFFHYHETVSLVQMATPGEVLILDPLAVRDLSSLGAILSSPRTRKILHGSDYDLRSFDRQYGFHFRNLYDTAVATSLLNQELMGLGRALEAYLGVKVSKPARLQRSDWSRRPIPADALEYAVQDAAHLIALHDALDAKLASLNRRDWMAEECALMEEIRFEPPPPPEKACFSSKGTFDLEPSQLAVFREFYLLRERDAERMDRPPFKVLSNEAMLAIAREPRRSLGDLPNANRRWIAERAGDIRAAVERGLNAPPITHPSKLKRQPNPWHDAARETWQNLNAARKKMASSLGIGPSTLWPTRSLEQIALHPEIVEQELSGTSQHGVRAWQRTVFGPALKTVLEGVY